MGKHVTLDESKGRTLFIDRKAGYAKNCKAGYRGDYWNAHHCVPCTSIQKSLKTYLDKKPPEYNKALARFTKWDVNAKPNLVGLPHKHAYRVAYGDTTSSLLALLLRRQWMMKKIQRPGGVRYPIHLPTSWGHVQYNGLVKTQLDSIWTALSVEIKDHEPIKADDMGSAIQGVGDAFRAILMAKVGQTKAAWQQDPKSPQFMMV
jgi:hypothetical protein